MVVGLILFHVVMALGIWAVSRGGDGPVREINNRELARLIEAGVKVVDIREPWEWQQTGVIEGSHLITAFDAQGRIEPDFASRLAGVVSPDEEVVIICRTGNRSGVLAPLLAEQLGYAKLRNVTQGILPWIQSGGRVVACRLEDGVPTC
jgi:rhodanese-related sulfurtransferase